VKTKFQLSHLLQNWQAIVEVDENRDSAAMRHAVEFWSGWNSRLRRHEGDWKSAFLEQLAREIFYVQAENSFTLVAEVVGAFMGREGWPKLDGSQGIKLISVEEVAFDYEDFTFEEI
jgi:hypothetical protein